MKALIALLPIGATLSALLVFGGQGQASDLNDGIKPRGGALLCGGSHFSRTAGNEQHRTSYVLRNFNRNATITIERFQVFNANGVVIFDYPGIDFPISVKTRLGPHETTQINTADILVGDLVAADRPIQGHVKWSSDQGPKVIPLDGSTVRTVRAVDTGEERSRASSACKLIGNRQ